MAHKYTHAFALLCVHVYTQVLPVLMSGCRSEHSDLRQCSVYGLGILAAKVGCVCDRDCAYNVCVCVCMRVFVSSCSVRLEKMLGVWPGHLGHHSFNTYTNAVQCTQSPEAFRPILPEALQLITAIISAPNAKDEDNEMATDNAVSALGRIIEFHRCVCVFSCVNV